jgi:Glyoxalase/Bleomycin resistance protein/Dioxygenase superfamily
MLMSAPLVQMAYVTNDFDRAIELFKMHYGVGKFLEMRDFEMMTWPGQMAIQNIGLAYAGDSPVQIELIQPLSGYMQVYIEPLQTATDFKLVFHHQAHLAKSPEMFDAMRAAAIAVDHQIVIDGETTGGSRYIYTDNRSTIGHHIEYIYHPEAVWEGLNAAIPRN